MLLMSNLCGGFKYHHSLRTKMKDLRNFFKKYIFPMNGKLIKIFRLKNNPLVNS